MAFEDILVNYVGQFGAYQALQYLIVQLPCMLPSMHSMSWTFTAAKMKHQCRYPDEDINATYSVDDPWYQYITNVTGDLSGCTRLANTTFGHYSATNSTTESCLDGYVWDHSNMLLSAVSRWNLTCDRQVIRAIIQSMYYVGQFIGSLIFGILADRIGRKPVFVLAIAIVAISGIAMAVSPWWQLLALFRIGVGMAAPGIAISGMVMTTELVGPKYRFLATGRWFFFALGQIILGGLAYPLRDYRYLQLAITLPALLFSTYWWLVPESPRWLVSRGRFEEAECILQRAAKFNGRAPLPPDWHVHLAKEKTQPHMAFFESLLSLFRTPRLRIRTAITMIAWSVVTMCYYGLALNPGFMGGDNRMGFILGGFLEFPGIVIMLFGLNVAGRKFVLSGGFFIATVCLLLTLAIRSKASVVSLLLVVSGKSALTVVFGACYIITPELYPTAVRNTATGLCSMIARAGGVAASFLALHLADKNPSAVALIFASLSLIAAIAAIFLPETTNAPLLETIEEAEAFGKDQPIFLFGYQCRRLAAEKVQDGNEEGLKMLETKYNPAIQIPAN